MLTIGWEIQVLKKCADFSENDGISEKQWPNGSMVGVIIIMSSRDEWQSEHLDT